MYTYCMKNKHFLLDNRVVKFKTYYNFFRISYQVHEQYQVSQFFTNMNLQMLSQQLFRYKLLLGIYAQSESLNNSEGHNHRSYGHKTNNYTHSLSFSLFCFLINSLQVCLLVVCKNLYVHLFRFSPLFVCFI